MTAKTFTSGSRMAPVAAQPPTFYAHHYASTADVSAPIDAVFSYLDDFRKLSAHMERPSAMMMGSKMRIDTDAQDGRSVGSHVRMHGTMVGIPLALEEVITERQPPLRKTWETVATNLLVIGRYRLGFELIPNGDHSNLRVFIDYDLPDTLPLRWLGRVFGKMYARWCTETMAKDAVAHFAP